LFFSYSPFLRDWKDTPVPYSRLLFSVRRSGMIGRPSGRQWVKARDDLLLAALGSEAFSVPPFLTLGPPPETFFFCFPSLRIGDPPPFPSASRSPSLFFPAKRAIASLWPSKRKPPFFFFLPFVFPLTTFCVFPPLSFLGEGSGAGGRFLRRLIGVDHSALLSPLSPGASLGGGFTVFPFHHPCARYRWAAAFFFFCLPP